MKDDSGTLSFIDIETPNRNNDRICSIAIIATKNEEIISEEYYLVNPESKLEQNKPDVTPAMLQVRPKFPEVWESMKHYFTNGIVAAYNANTDLTILYRTLCYYKINIPDIYYICIMEMAKTAYHRVRTLSDLCLENRIKLDAHNGTFENALVCGQLFFKLQKKFKFKLEDLVKQYTPYENLLQGGLDSMLSRAINELDGIVQGISYDNKITNMEIVAFENWTNKYSACIGESQLVDMMHIIRKFIAEKKVTAEDIGKLDSIIHRFQLKRTKENDPTKAMQTLRGIIQGLTSEDAITEEEILALEKWVKHNKSLSGNYTFTKIEDKLNSILEDGKITQKEKDELYKTLSSIV